MTSSAHRRVLLVDDHPVFRFGVRQFIAGCAGFEMAGEVGDGKEALAFLRKSAADIVFLDLEMAGLDGVGFLRELESLPVKKPKVIVLSRTINPALTRNLQNLGIHGYILKTEGVGAIESALAAVERGEQYFSPAVASRLWSADSKRHSGLLTDREYEVAKLMSQGRSTKAIAEALGCAPSTVKTHRTNLMRKLMAKNSAAVARWVTAAELGA